MPFPQTLFATCTAGLEALLADELQRLGATTVRRAGAGVSFHADRALAYRVCLWSRLANRVLLPLHEAPAASPEALYAAAREIDWATHLAVEGTVAVDFFCARSNITHSQYGALTVKDAVVDQFRESTGVRPSVDREAPDVRINVYLYRNQARIALDLSGSGLHRRGYRRIQGPAPLKENLAAALLVLCDWPALAASGGVFVDPMCGAGTLAIEAALMAAGRAPGLTRSYFGFLGWRQHDAGCWQALIAEAEAVPAHSPVPIVAFDASSEAVAATSQHVNAAGMTGVQVARRTLGEPLPAGLAQQLGGGHPCGLFLTNPPYGERLQAGPALYRALGRDMARYFSGWRGAVFCAIDSPVNVMRLPLKPLRSLRNGAIDCQLLAGPIPELRREQSVRQVPVPSSTADPWPAAGQPNTVVRVDNLAFANRVRKNLRALSKWAQREAVHAYRIYDADLPDFSMAIDLYELAQRHVLVQEYQAPARINRVMAESRLAAAVQVLPEVLGVPPERIHLRTRARQRGTQQYQAHSPTRPEGLDRPGEGGRAQGAPRSAPVTGWLDEYGARLEVNLSDYLDTGVFPDHRKVRKYIRENARDKGFLNLFAYTAAATVQAATGGASHSVSVDLSRRYCEWAERNLLANRASPDHHRVVREDVMSWLGQQASGRHQSFDLILLDPPTFSNSTRTDHDWDVQRDHRAAIEACLELLALEGLLIFSTNFRRFRLDQGLSFEKGGPALVDDRTRWSIDRDYQRNQRIHQCWFIRHAAARHTRGF